MNSIPTFAGFLTFHPQTVDVYAANLLQQRLPFPSHYHSYDCQTSATLVQAAFRLARFGALQNSGELSEDPQDWVMHKVTQVLDDYHAACYPEVH